MQPGEPGQPIDHELSIGEIISKTFDLYRQDFVKYFVLFAIVEVIIGVLSSLLRHSFTSPSTTSTTLTASQLVSIYGSFAGLALLTFVLTIVFFPIAQGTAIKTASEQIEAGRTDLQAMIRFTVSRLLSIWGLSILVGIIVFLGFIALVIPGIILAIMFGLSFPVLLIEKKGIIDSLSRSRALVSNRWLKTFVTFLAIGIIIAIATLIASLISGPFGVASPVVSGLLSAFYQPLIPILLAVYYYSNRARLEPVNQMPPPPPVPGQATGGTSFCPSCGSSLPAGVTFCPNCGARISS